MGLELAALLAISRRLPRVKGAGRIANWLRTIYTRRPRPTVVADVRGSKMELRPAEFVEGWLLFGPQYYEDPEIQFVRSHLARGDVFVDIGAHIGLYALVASRRVGPEGRVIAIEANPGTATILQANLDRNDARNVDVARLGVSDRSETLRLGISAVNNQGGNSFLFNEGGTVDVACQALDEILLGQSVTSVTVAKLDIEGFEFKVLRRFLQAAPRSLWPRWILTEFHPDWIALSGGDVVDLLGRHGYRKLMSTELNHAFELETSSDRPL